MTAHKLTCILFFAFLALGHRALALAEDNPPKADGNLLLAYCTAAINMLDGDASANVDEMKAGFCVGYLAGFDAGHALTVLENRGSVKKPNVAFVFCTADREISANQKARIVVKFLQEHPNTLDLPMEFLTMRALSEAFPCK